jgi:hypothetical protein
LELCFPFHREIDQRESLTTRFRSQEIVPDIDANLTADRMGPQFTRRESLTLQTFRSVWID